ncbi:addiction module protein [Methyloversatilis discipulorum]|uniref:addiction module protein n=1 Tax=Methyloversatilis discipulorum TaxID=1119528 RepID=UPI003F3B5F73
MPRPLEVLAEEVLQLAPEARAKLLDHVVASLNADRARDAAWDALAASRDAELELESGEAVAIPVEQTLTRLRAELE